MSLVGFEHCSNVNCTIPIFYGNRISKLNFRIQQNPGNPGEKSLLQGNSWKSRMISNQKSVDFAKVLEWYAQQLREMVPFKKKMRRGGRSGGLKIPVLFDNLWRPYSWRLSKSLSVDSNPNWFNHNFSYLPSPLHWNRSSCCISTVWHLKRIYVGNL